MNSKVVITICMVFFSAALAFADYGALEKEFNEYHSSYYEQTRKENRATVQKKTIEPDRFDLKRGQIEKQRLIWAQTIEAPDATRSFYHPDRILFKKMAPAQNDAAFAADVVKKTYTLDSLEILTLLRNPQIKSEEENFRAAVESFSYVANLDEILRRYTALTEGVMTGVGPMKGKESIRMKFPFPGVLSLKGQVAVQNVSAARETLEIARRDAITEARKTCWNLLFIDKAMTITQKTLQLLTRLEKVAVTRYEAGKTSYQDVVKVRIKRKTLNEDLITLRERQGNLKTKIRELLNIDTGTPVEEPQVIHKERKTPDPDSLYAMALDNRQELRKMRFDIAKTERMIEMAETMILPAYTSNFSLFEDEAIVQVGSMAMKPTFATTIKSSTGAGLPKMPWFGTQDAYLRETRKKLAGMEQKLVNMEAKTKTLVRMKWFALDQAVREEALFRRTIVDLSQSALDVSNRGYESGNASFADVINSYTLWLNSNLTLARKKSDLGIAWVNLEQAIGTVLPSSQIN